MPESLFAFRLSLALGLPHPDYLSELITWQQFVEWLAYYEIEPWGDWRADERQEVFRERLMAGMFGSDAKVPRHRFPYHDKPLTREEVKAMWQATEQALEWDGTRYVWRKTDGK